MLADTLMADGGVISTLVSSVDVVVLIVVVGSRKDTEKNKQLMFGFCGFGFPNYLNLTDYFSFNLISSSII